MRPLSPKQLFARACEFVAGSGDPASLKLPDLPEIAFVGRSNVGKSSLINCIFNRKNLARTSRTPGRTQEINFFRLEDYALFVDLPGYGFADVPIHLKHHWQKDMTRYITTRRNLRLLFVLVDARHGLKPIDHDLFHILQGAGTAFQVILTKADKIKPSEQTVIHQETHAALLDYMMCVPEVFLSSASKKIGIEQIHKRIFHLVFPDRVLN